MKVKVLQDFRDKTAGLKMRKIDEIMEVDKARAEKLIVLGLAVECQPELKKDTKEAAN